MADGACPNCAAPAAAGAAECPACGVIFAKWAKKAVPVQAKCRELTPRQAVVIPGAAFALAGALAWSAPGRFFIQAGLAMQVHELGHALVSWLGGRFAVPLPMITLSFSHDRSLAFGLAVTAALAWTAAIAWDQDCGALAALGGVLLIFQAALSLLMRPDALDFWVAFGGLGGECVLSALLIILYFHPLPRAARWPAYRAVFLFIGACVLASSLRRWRDADSDFMNVPWGSFFGGDGDVEAMIGGGWTVNALVKVYLRMAWICAAAAGAAWASAAWKFRGLWTRPAELLD